MNSLAIVLVLFSAFMHALRNFYTKKAEDKQIFVWWYGLFALIFYLPVFVYILFQEEISWLVIGLGIIGGVVHLFEWYFLAKAYEHGDLSQVYPIMRSAPALVLIFAVIFLQEKVTLQGILGILIAMIGAYLINIKEMRISELISPFTFLLKDRATQFAFANLVIVAIYSITDKIGTNYSNPLIFVYLISTFTFLFFTPYILLVKPRTKIQEEWKAHKKTILTCGFFEIFGYALILLAFTLDKVSYVIGLRQVSILFGVLLGAYLLKEKHTLIRTAAATIIVVGAFLISTAH